jgi:esterase/lipase superfamily enzyme
VYDAPLAGYLIPEWLFAAVARALMRTANALQGLHSQRASFAIFSELEKNRRAIRIYRRLPPESQSLVVNIVAITLRDTGFLLTDNDELRPSATQLRSSHPQGFANDLIAEIHGEYVRWAESRPEFYLAPFSGQLTFAQLDSEFEGPDPGTAGPREYLLTVPRQIGGAGPRAKRERYAKQLIFVATAHPERAAEHAVQHLRSTSRVTYESVEVSIPDVHFPGQFERPAGYKGIELREDPEKHIVIDVSTFENLTLGEFLQRASTLSPHSNSALIFVHGFATTRNDAIMRTAQLAHDIPFGGPAIAFCWPSRGSINPVDYTKDYNDALAAGDDLADTIVSLRSSGIQNIFVLAHSMGGQVVAEASLQISKQGVRTPGAFILAAPDVDRRIFQRRSPEITASTTHVTMYASSNDKVLGLSISINGHARAGDARDILVCNGIDTIDASNVPTDFLGHGYFCSNTELLEDIRLALSTGRPPRGTLIQARTTLGETYWKFPTAAASASISLAV